MIKSIGWQSLQERRAINRLTLMYQVVYGLTDTNFTQLLSKERQPGERTARTVSGTSEQTKTATDHYFYHVRFQNGIIFPTKLEMLYQLTHLNHS